jgi:SAM-dependent methyltransferase
VSSKFPPVTTPAATDRCESYGQQGLTLVDRLGVWLSKRPIERVIGQYQNPVVADLGCGYEAKLLRQLEPRITAGVGVDVSISTAARSASPKLSFSEAPIEDVVQSLGENRFDVVMLVSVLEHLWKPADVLASCHHLLKPGGSLIVNVPNWRGKVFLEFSAFKLGMSPALEMDDHKMYYSKQDLWPLLVRAGFKPSRIRLRYHKFGLNLFAVARRQESNDTASPAEIR